MLSQSVICGVWVCSTEASRQFTRQILLGNPRIRFVEKGHQIDDNLYVAYGQTYGGRYLAVFFVYKRASATTIIISARNMMKRE